MIGRLQRILIWKMTSTVRLTMMKKKKKEEKKIEDFATDEFCRLNIL